MILHGILGVMSGLIIFGQIKNSSWRKMGLSICQMIHTLEHRTRAPWALESSAKALNVATTVAMAVLHIDPAVGDADLTKGGAY
jgi:hypothetical protein